MFTYNNGRIVIHRITKKDEIRISKEKIKNNNRYNEKLIALPQNDTGNAKRFLLYCKDFVKYNTTLQCWMFWNGKYWSIESAYDEIIMLAQSVMDKYYAVAMEDTKLDAGAKKSILYHAKSSNNRPSLDNMLTLVMHMNYVKEMKSEPHLLNVQNGVVDLKKKKLMPHHPKYGCINICRCDYDPDVKSSRFKLFVKEITDFDQELYTYLKTLAGYWITGLRNEEQFYTFRGTGANGKSKYLEVIEYTLNNYADLFPTDALTKANTDSGRPTPEIVPLINVRYARTSELKADHVINDACIKQYTGNSQLLVRKMRQEYSKVDISFKIAIDTNYEPKFRQFDEAIKRRLVIIPFDKKFEGKAKDLNIIEKLKADYRYVLKWLIDGAYLYYKNGLHEPEVVKAATKEYCMDADTVGNFIENATIAEKGNLIKSSVLHQAYLEFCNKNSIESVDNKTFSQIMVRKGFKKKIKNSGTYFYDIKLLDLPTTPTTPAT